MPYLLISFLVVISSFSKSEFYTVLKNGSSAKLIELEKKLNAQSSDGTQQAYLGTLNMKLSETQKTSMEKLKLFKIGKAQLEKSIASHPENIEYRFLRLIIQENAPKILRYHLQIGEDAKLITAKIGTVDSELKIIIVQYSESSKNLNL